MQAYSTVTLGGVRYLFKSFAPMTASTQLSIAFVPFAYTVAAVHHLVTSADDLATVNWVLRYGDTPFNATFTEVLSGGFTADATREEIAVFTNASVPANKYLWVAGTGSSGSPIEFALAVVIS